MRPAPPAAPPPARPGANCCRPRSSGPCGIRPPAAIAAATRAILNGEISTGPCPYAANGSALRSSAGSPVEIPICAAVSASAFDPTSCTPNCAKYALQETAMARSISSVPCAWSPMSSLIGRFQPAITVPARPSGSVRHRNVRCLSSGSSAQRRDGRDQLEGRARRILPVARAVEQLVRRRRAPRVPRRTGRRRAHHRQHVARGRVHHHQRAFAAPRASRKSPLQNLLGPQLQPDVQRQPHIAVARQHARHRRIAGLMPVAHQRRQLRILIALQLGVGIVLHQRSVGGVKILARAQVAQQVRRRRAERIVPAVEARAGCSSEMPSAAYSARWRSSSANCWWPAECRCGRRCRRAESRAPSNSCADCAAAA